MRHSELVLRMEVRLQIATARETYSHAANPSFDVAKCNIKRYATIATF